MIRNKAIAVAVKNVSENYRVKFSYPEKTIERKVTAIEDINLTIYKGEALAVLGPNGAGKTTLLKTIAGIIKPDTGEIVVNGNVRGIFELEAGFIPELTGYGNIKMVLNLCEIQDESILRNIIEFSELKDFIYAPLKTYSQGMYLRLAFSVAIHTNPEILIIDDILAVGDFHFQKKCIAKIKDIISSGKTVILVTHNFDLAGSLCERCIVLERGRIFAQGSLQEVKNLFTDLSGNLWGIACIKNKKMDLVFNNGRIILRYKNQPITADLGIFASYKRGNGVLYSTDLSWEATEELNQLEAQGAYGDSSVCTFRIKISEENINFILESEFPGIEFNLMFSDIYSKFQAKNEILDLPLMNGDLMGEWQKGTEVLSDHLRIIPQGNMNYPEILLRTYLDKKANFELFNHHFNNPARVVRISTLESGINLKILFIEKSKPDMKQIKSNTILADLAAGINDFLIDNQRIQMPLIKKINFLSNTQEEAFEDFECEIINTENFPDVQFLIHFRKIDASLLFTSIINDKVIFKLSSATPNISKLFKGIGLIIFPNFLYKYYTAYHIEGEITKETSFVKTDVLKLESVKKWILPLQINLNRKTSIELIKDGYEHESVNIKLFSFIDQNDYIVTLSI